MSSGKNEYRLGALRESMSEARDLFLDVLKHPEKLTGKGRFWLEEVLWQHKEELRVVSELYDEPTFHTQQQLFGVELDLEFLLETYRLIKPPVEDPALSDLVAFNDWLFELHKAEKAWPGFNFTSQAALLFPADEPAFMPQEIERIRHLDAWLQSSKIQPHSLTLLVRLVTIQNRYGDLVKRLDWWEERQARKVTEQLTAAAISTSPDSFHSAYRDAVDHCDTVDLMLIASHDEQLIVDMQKERRAMRNAVITLSVVLGASTPEEHTHKQAQYSTIKYRSEELERSVVKAIARFENSRTRWGRFANWLDSILASKDPT